MLLQRTVAEVAALVDGRVEGEGERVLVALRPPEEAGPDDLVALFRASAVDAVASGRAGCVLLRDGLSLPAAGRSLIRVADAEAALDRLVAACAPREAGPARGVHATAVVEPGAVLAPDVAVGPFVHVGARARVGARTELWTGAVVGEEAVLGEGCRLMPRAVLGARCRLGARVVLHPGAVIGSDGFGYRPDAAGRLLKIPQVGTVELGDDVEVGANSTVDRARLGVTRLGDGTKLDDHVHIAHNCLVGAHCAIAAQSGLAGRVVMGDHVMMGGQSGVAGGLTVGTGAQILGKTLVTKDVPPGGTVAGVPGRPRAVWAREQAALRRMVRREGGEGADGA